MREPQFFIPKLDDVREFARRLNDSKEPWQGDAFGWQAEYLPEAENRPLGSRLTITPAEFWIDESGVWFFSMCWENGKDISPIEHLDESGLVRS